MGFRYLLCTLFLMSLVILPVCASPNTGNVTDLGFAQKSYILTQGSNSQGGPKYFNQIAFKQIEYYPIFNSVLFEGLYSVSNSSVCAYCQVNKLNRTSNYGSMGATLWIGPIGTGTQIATGILSYQVVPGGLYGNDMIIIRYGAYTWTPGTFTGLQITNISADWSQFNLYQGGSYYSTTSQNLTNADSVYFRDTSLGAMNGGDPSQAIANHFKNWIEYTDNFAVAYNRTQGFPYDYFNVDKYFNGIHYNTQTIFQTTIDNGATWTEVLNDTSNETLWQFPILSYKGEKLVIVNPLSGASHTYIWNSTGSNMVPGCNITAITQNTANGNAVSGSTFNIYDITKGTSESFYLPYGAGSVSIPYMNDNYASNATKSGYTGYPAFPLGAGWQIPGSSTTCEGTTLYAQLTGPPQSATNGTLTFFVHDTSDYPLAIPGASVILNTGQVATTNLAGTSVFNLLILNETYNYSVTKPAYFPVDGDVTISTSGVYVEVELTQGIQPTATVTVTPTTTATAMRTCAYGDLNCAFDESMKFIGSGVQFIIGIGYYIMVLTLLWMFIYAATGEIPGYKRNKGGGRGGSIFGNIRWK